MISDLLEENADLRKQVEELKDEIATRNGKLAILISENERLKGIVLGNEEEISDLKKSCDETQELLDKQIEATYKLDKENAELKEKLSEQKQYTAFKCNEFVKKKEVYEREHFFLTSAKEIIREFVEWANWQGNSKCPSFKSIQDKAEQFISEVNNALS